MMEMHDIVVVGGGPAGCKSAVSLSRDFNVRIIEEHETSGSPVQCTGLFSKEVIRLSGVKPEILNTLHGARFVFPNGKDIVVESKDEKAVLVDRKDLDRKMADAAVDAGAKIDYSRKYLSHTVSDKVTRIETTKGTMESIMIIGADGHSSKVAASLGDNQPKEYVRGIQYDIKHRMEHQDMIQISIGNDVAPGFFAWQIPFGDFTRVGLCCDWNRGLPSEFFTKLLVKNGLDGCEVVSKYSGKIPLGGRRTSYGENLLLIGDAAGQVKPISGGGLYPAFIASASLERTVRDAMEKGDFSARFLSSYEKSWKKDVGNNLDKSYSMRKYYRKMTDSELNIVQEKMCKDKYKDLFASAEIDDPGVVVKKALKDIPLLLSVIPLAVKVGLRR